MNSFSQAVKLCRIKCTYCLDRKQLYREAYGVFALNYYLGANPYEIVKCIHCCGGRWDQSNIKYVKTKENYVDGELVLWWLASDDDKLESLKNKIAKTKEKNKQKEKIALVKMNDGKKEQLYNGNVNDKCENIVEKIHISFEIGKHISKILTLINKDNLDLISQISNFNVNINFINEEINQTHSECFLSWDTNGYPVYVLLKFKVDIKKKSSWFSKEEMRVETRYNIAYPRNNAAKEHWDSILTEIVGENMIKMRNYMVSNTSI